jgi:hypothetical protein
MARPLRIEFPGALSHVTSRGNGRADIFLDDSDRQGCLAALRTVCHRLHWLCYAYSQLQGVLVKGVDFCRDLRLKATFTSLYEQKSLSQS